MLFTFSWCDLGFFVAKTKDLIDSAKEFKEKGNGSPVERLSLVDVPIGRVRSLALSTDNLTLAAVASVSGDIWFYSVESFLNKVHYFLSLFRDYFIVNVLLILIFFNQATEFVNILEY